MNISELLENLKTNIDTMSMSEKILGGFATALLAMLVVFTILVIISLIIRVINAKQNDKTDTSNNKVINDISNNIREVLAAKAEEDINHDTNENDELIAIITAAIVATSGKSIIVKRITRTNNNKSNWEKITNT